MELHPPAQKIEGTFSTQYGEVSYLISNGDSVSLFQHGTEQELVVRNISYKVRMSFYLQRDDYHKFIPGSWEANPSHTGINRQGTGWPQKEASRPACRDITKECTRAWKEYISARPELLVTAERGQWERDVRRQEAKIKRLREDLELEERALARLHNDEPAPV